LVQRFKVYDIALIACLLDPRFKHMNTFLVGDKDKAIRMLHAEYKKLPEPPKPPVKPEKKESLLESVTPFNSNEVTSYLDMANVPTDTNILEWWKVQAQFPRLQTIALKYLAIPATSVPVERLFSCGGVLVTKKRAALHANTVREIVFLYTNKKHIQ